MILFSFPQYEHYASKLRKLPGWKRGLFSVDRYHNHELFIQLKTSVREEACAILAETAPPDENLLSLLLLAHTLKKEGAEKIVVIIPYLGYARHDRQEAGRDMATAWLGESLRNAGVTEVVTIDAHSTIDAELFPIPLRSLSPAGILANTLRVSPIEMTLVAPDAGAVDNCESVRDALGKDIAIARCEKKRAHGRISSVVLRGEVNGRAVLVDDMLDTGATLLECAKKMRAAGARSSVVLVSHGLFNGTEWRQLWVQGVTHIYCTDTVPRALRFASKKVTVLPAVGILVDYFKQAAYGKRD